jgi:predicted nuclease of predicted toxin-antitoxin system
LRFADLSFLADENIHPDVLEFLRRSGTDILAASGMHLAGRGDADLLDWAAAEQRGILTHDSDFGRLAIGEAKTVFGIVYLRPGHIKPSFTIATLRTVLAMERPLEPPFLLVARRTESTVRIRIRRIS